MLDGKEYKHECRLWYGQYYVRTFWISFIIANVTNVFTQCIATHSLIAWWKCKLCSLNIAHTCWPWHVPIYIVHNVHVSTLFHPKDVHSVRHFSKILNFSDIYLGYWGFQITTDALYELLLPQQIYFTM